MGDTTALDASESAVVEVIFLLRKGLLAAGRLETVEEAMLLDLGEIDWPGKEDRVGSKTARVRQEKPRSTSKGENWIAKGEGQGREKKAGSSFRLSRVRKFSWWALLSVGRLSAICWDCRS